jgi:autophagy-related protein 9
MPHTLGRAQSPIFASKSLQPTQALGTSSSSRPFTNVLNPMSRRYQGYTRADQPLEEEENEAGSNGEEDDLEAGRSRAARSAKARGKRRVAWDGEASELRVLHPNIHREDPMHDRESSDEEVPHSFKVETTTPRATSSKPSRTRDHDSSFGVRRAQPLHSVAGRAVPPPTLPKSLHPSASPPSRPSEVDRKAAADPTAQSLPQFSETSSNPSSRSRPLVRGLDNYERALWNWVNVYNLDAFLHEVYSYYEGKGIFSIALARGLNLL